MFRMNHRRWLMKSLWRPKRQRQMQQKPVTVVNQVIKIPSAATTVDIISAAWTRGGCLRRKWAATQMGKARGLQRVAAEMANLMNLISGGWQWRSFDYRQTRRCRPTFVRVRPRCARRQRLKAVPSSSITRLPMHRNGAPLTRSRPAMTSSGGLQWTTLFCANDATAATGGRRMGAGETAEVTRLAALQADGGAEREGQTYADGTASNSAEMTAT